MPDSHESRWFVTWSNGKAVVSEKLYGEPDRGWQPAPRQVRFDKWWPPVDDEDNDGA